MADGTGDFCLYTFCGHMDAELSPQGGGVFNGPLAVAATINDETAVMRFEASIDVIKLTFSVVSASGDEITSYVGTCESYDAPDTE